MIRLIALSLIAAAMLGGCSRTMGYAGKHPGYIKCVGKGAITGTGSFNVAAGIGGGEQNHFTIQADCGDGFQFIQGNPEWQPTEPATFGRDGHNATR